MNVREEEKNLELSVVQLQAPIKNKERKHNIKKQIHLYMIK